MDTPSQLINPTEGLPPGTITQLEDSGGRLLDAAALWPVVLLATLGVIVGALAAVGISLGVATPFVFLALLVPLAIGLRRAAPHRRKVLRLAAPLCLLALLASWLVLWDFTGHPLPDTPSFAPDTWAYNAISHYLEHHSRREVGGMNALDQYGSRHRNDRLLSGAMLAVWRHATHSLEAANFIFTILCLAMHFLGMFFFTRALTGGRNVPLLAAFLSTTAGWMCNAIMVGNYDNLLFLAFAPALLGIAVRFLSAESDPTCAVAPGFQRWVLPAATLMAAMFYGYPEGAALLAATALPLGAVVAWSCLPRRGRDTARFRTVVALGGLTLLLVLPEIPVFVDFLHRQMSASLDHQSARPGEGVFAGLIQPGFLPALFALGEEGPGAPYRKASLLLALFLIVLVVAGALSIGRRHRWYPWIGGILLTMDFWFGTIRHYDYAIYKVVFCACWWVYPALAVGLRRLVHGLWPGGAWIGAALASVSLLVGIGVDKAGDRKQRALPPGSYSLNTLQDLAAVPALVQSSPILVDLNNELDEIWAVYYLSRLRLLPVGVSGYMEAARSELAKGRDGQLRPADCRYSLISGLRQNSLWHDARCSLVENVAGARITRISCPDGEDIAGPEQVCWVGSLGMTLAVEADAAGSYEVRVGRWWFGPGLPGSEQRTVQITDAAGQRTVVVTPQTRGIPLELRQGSNQVKLRCLDTPSVRIQPNGDTRELLLALVDPFIVNHETH